MLMLSVGGTADSRMANAYVMQGKGPDSTARALRAIAAGPQHNPLVAAVIALLIALSAVGFYAAMAYGYGNWVQDAQNQLAPQMVPPGTGDIGDLFR
jgi:hypothetical protein